MKAAMDTVRLNGLSKENGITDMNEIDPVTIELLKVLGDLKKELYKLNTELTIITTWREGFEKACEKTHSVVDTRLNAHAIKLENNKSILDTWKGYAFVISVAMSVGTIVGVIIKYL